jgi:hypothetical protein
MLISSAKMVGLPLKFREVRKRMLHGNKKG